MRITIGEILNEVIKYSSHVESSIRGSTPLIIAYLSRQSVTRVYLYIAQVGDHRYTAVSDIFDMMGSRFHPTGMIENPFTREIDNIHSMYDGSLSLTEKYTSRVSNVSYPDMIDFIHGLLKQYEIIDVSRNVLNSKLSSIGFNSSRIIKSIENGFPTGKVGTINDLISIVIKNKTKFQLSGLRAKEIKVVSDKMSDKGIYATIENGSICDITLRRKK